MSRWRVGGRPHLVVGVVVLRRGLLAPRLVPVGGHRQPVVSVRDGAVRGPRNVDPLAVEERVQVLVRL